MIDLTPILQGAIGIISALITVFLLPYIKSKISTEKQAEMEEWVSIAVTAAEQIYNGPGRGEEKKAYVISFLEAKGYAVNAGHVLDAVNALIEAMVYELKK